MGIYLVILLSLIFLVLMFIIFIEVPESDVVGKIFNYSRLCIPLILFSLLNILVYSISIYLVYIYLF